MPEIRILEPGDEATLEAFVLPRVESSMFLVGNLRAAGLVDLGQRFGGTYAAAFEGDRILGVVAHYWNGNLVLQAPAHLDALWRAAARTSGRGIGGMLGPAGQVAAVREALEAALHLDEILIQMDEVENLYSLDLADLQVPEGLVTGRWQARRIESRDLEQIIAWRVAFGLESLGEVDSPELWARYQATVERGFEDGRIWLLEDGGRPVSTSGFNSAIAEAVQVGGVYTPPRLRSQGYARAVVAASLLDVRARGVGKAILFTGVSNLSAQKAYLALGFRHIGDYRILLLRFPVDAGV